MSHYDDRRTSTRERRRSDDYDDDTVYANTRNNQRSTALVRRRDDSPDYDESRREYSPGRAVYRETTIRRSGTRPVGRARSYDNDDRSYDDRSRYSDRRESYYKSDRRSGNGGRRDSDYRSSRQERYSESSSRSPSPRRKRERRKSMPEEALEALGLGGVAAALTGKKRNSRSGSRDRDGRNRSRGGGGDRSKSHGREQLIQSAKAAILAGAATAFRARGEPGGWGGEKGKRILTAAITAGGVDGLINMRKDPEKHKLRDTVGSAIAGVAADRVVNGPRSQSRGRGFSPDGRGGSRSRSRLGSLAAGGGLAAAAKKFTDSVRGRSQSRSRARSRSRSYDSYDSRSPPKRSRSRSIAGRALSAVGLDSQANRVDPSRARARSRSRGGGRYADDDGSSYYDNREVGTSRSIDSETGAMIHRPKSAGPDGGLISPPPPDYHLDYGPKHTGDPETDSESDLGSSSEDEKDRHKGRKRLVITGGLASVATIHAGHSVYQSYEKRQARRKAVQDGTISKEQAKKNKTRDRLQDAASIGLAALGIKGAYSEWKEMKEVKEEHEKEKDAKDRHAWKRENRRRKASMARDGIYGDNGYANSAPNLYNPFGRDGLMSPPPGGNNPAQGAYYSGDGPYMSGAAQGVDPSQRYYEEQHGWMGHEQAQNDAYVNPYAPGYTGNGTTNGNVNFPSPPVQGGTGFPPPPAAQPPPPTQTRP